VLREQVRGLLTPSAKGLLRKLGRCRRFDSWSASQSPFRQLEYIAVAVSGRLEVGWRGRLEAGWRQAGGRLGAGWRQAGGRLEASWRQAGGRLEAGWRASGKSLEIENSIDSRHDGVSMEGNRSIHRTIGRGQGRRKLRHVQANIEIADLLEASQR
jgi:hypothetical protein